MIYHTTTEDRTGDGRACHGHEWEGEGFRLLVRQSLLHPGLVFVQSVNSRPAYRTEDGWIPCPPWVHAALGDPAADPAGPLDWLVENAGDHDWLAGAVARVAAAPAGWAAV